MASILKNLSSYDAKSMPSAADMKFGVIVSEWNSEITEALLRGAVETLLLNGAKEENIDVRHVPGSFELTSAAGAMARKGLVDAVICLGCVIRGDTPHFDYVCSGVTQGITELNIKYDIPFIFGLLTTNDLEQARARSGGSLGNKGTECAVTAIKMVDLICNL